MFKKTPMFMICLIYVSVFMVTSLFSQERSLKRDEIDAKYKWNLNDIYPDWNSWEQDFQKLEARMEGFAQLKGTLSQGPGNLLRALRLKDNLNIIGYHVYQYPKLMRDTDTRDSDVSGHYQEVQILFSKFGTTNAWFRPELLQIPWDTMKVWLDETPGLAPYRHNIEDLYRQQSHVLPEDKETLLSYFSGLRRTPNAIYSELSTSDIDFPEITLSDSQTAKITPGKYGLILATDRSQENRKEAFDALYGTYQKNENTYAAIYNAVCQDDWAIAQARNYNSTLESYLESDNVPLGVYENLVKTVKENTAPLQRYIRLRKQVLGLKEYHLYDGSISLTDLDKTYPYEEAKKWVMEAVKPLGKEYQQKLQQALQGGWIDVYENEGKRAGAYSSGVYGVHPYMLLNYNGTLRYVFTLAHELGHTMHTTFSNENQPFATSDYTIFVAEVPSTLNEKLLLDYLMKKSKDPKERISLLQQSIDNIVGTFYTQVMFADFELQAHRLVEEGKPITAKALNGIMADLVNAYYGDAITSDDLFNSFWARVHHFYGMPYYVYQYATCYASSAKIYNDMTTGTKDEQRGALERFTELLKSGGNDYPMEQLRKAGVDLNKPEPVLAVVRQLNDLVDQLEQEITKL
ncbi:MAG: oligoendopeptidase F [Calditrichia bacterium]